MGTYKRRRHSRDCDLSPSERCVSAEDAPVKALQHTNSRRIPARNCWCNGSYRPIRGEVPARLPCAGICTTFWLCLIWSYLRDYPVERGIVTQLAGSCQAAKPAPSSTINISSKNPATSADFSLFEQYTRVEKHRKNTLHVCWTEPTSTA